MRIHIFLYVCSGACRFSEPERFPGIRFGVPSFRFGPIRRPSRQTGRRQWRGGQRRLQPVRGEDKSKTTLFSSKRVDEHNDD